MELKLGWDEMVELVYKQRVEIDGATLIFSVPKVTISLTRPLGEEHGSPPRTPDTDDERLLVKVLERGLASLAADGNLPPHDAAALDRLAGELAAMLAGKGG